LLQVLIVIVLQTYNHTEPRKTTPRGFRVVEIVQDSAAKT